MPIPTTFLAGCRTAAESLPELAAFRTAGAMTGTTAAARAAQWGAMFGKGTTGTSAADRLRQAIRNTVAARADIVAATTGTVITAGERESATATLVGEYAPATPRPTNPADELATFLRAAAEDQT